MITAKDKLIEEIAKDFGMKGWGNGKLELTGIKCTNDEERKN